MPVIPVTMKAYATYQMIPRFCAAAQLASMETFVKRTSMNVLVMSSSVVTFSASTHRDHSTACVRAATQVRAVTSTLPYNWMDFCF